MSDDWSGVATGARLMGVIERIEVFGLWVRVGPEVAGWVFIPDVSWTERVTDLNERFALGQQIQVAVLGVDRDAIPRAVSFGIKQLEPDPWQDAEQLFLVSSVHNSEVVKQASFGTFCQLTPGVVGLIRDSTKSQQKQVGERLEVVVHSVDVTMRQIELGVSDGAT